MGELDLADQPEPHQRVVPWLAGIPRQHLGPLDVGRRDQAALDQEARETDDTVFRLGAGSDWTVALHCIHHFMIEIWAR